MPNYANQLSGSLDSRPALNQQQVSNTLFLLSSFDQPKIPQKEKYMTAAGWLGLESLRLVGGFADRADPQALFPSQPRGYFCVWLGSLQWRCAVSSAHGGKVEVSNSWVCLQSWKSSTPEAHVGLSGCIQTLIGWLPGILIMVHYNADLIWFNW